MTCLTYILKAYQEGDPKLKCEAVFQAKAAFDPSQWVHPGGLTATVGIPNEPLLVRPKDVPQRKLSTTEGRAALWHAIAHIEFNAINLALDALLRFPGMPTAYYEDWLRVASEEAYHFSLIDAHLQTLGYHYGDFKAHGGLWEMAQKTANSVLVRMGLVPRVMEARGLDVTPGIMQKLELAGDGKAGEILGIILRDEISHVMIGNRWFRYCCEKEGLDPLETFESLAHEYIQTQLRGPYDREKRLVAGFSEQEMDWLEAHYP